MKIPEMDREILQEALDCYRKIYELEKEMGVPINNRTVRLDYGVPLPKDGVSHKLLEEQANFLLDRELQRESYICDLYRNLEKELRSMEAEWRNLPASQVLEQAVTIASYRNCCERLIDDIQPEQVQILGHYDHPLKEVVENNYYDTGDSIISVLEGMSSDLDNGYDIEESDNPFLPLEALENWTPLFDAYENDEMEQSMD